MSYKQFVAKQENFEGDVPLKEAGFIKIQTEEDSYDL
jgi:hypothetical protein